MRPGSFAVPVQRGNPLAQNNRTGPNGLRSDAQLNGCIWKWINARLFYLYFPFFAVRTFGVNLQSLPYPAFIPALFSFSWAALLFALRSPIFFALCKNDHDDAAKSRNRAMRFFVASFVRCQCQCRRC
ncbi:hypothetical protein BX661DRAFT_175949 [Kickxella alabastrina]|uniref:uncharacterized protein n=1 Tax=Kickxella alabastrina TaxID=61397 RepID=UPI0022209475|nr:uncharacterized protein BX661DRAFT_175949 [Kickxella alabastrina]KAI7835015.1 hypothetical protein BX661DRAFT_175949 [Kickxella alabastrina]